MKRNIFYIITTLFVATSLYLCRTESEKQKIYTVVNAGLGYIYNTQQETGEIPSVICENRDLTEGCVYDTNYFIVASTLYSLDSLAEKINNPYREKVVTRGISYLKTNIPKDYLWRYWKEDYRTVDPDTDDTALISYILSRHGVKSNNIKVFFPKRNEAGLFYTWILRENKNNNIDSVVNTNVALYLQNNEVNAKICKYLSTLIKDVQESFSHQYYLDDFSLYYAMSRAYRDNMDCFGDEKELIINKLVSLQDPSGAIGNNSLTTAFSLNSLLNFNYQNKSFYNKSISYLIKNQQPDGGWGLHAFLPLKDIWYSGSRSYTTAVTLEALSKYYSR